MMTSGPFIEQFKSKWHHNNILNILILFNFYIDICSRGNVAILEMLLQRNAQLDVLTLRGKTPLHMAVKNRMTESVRLLIHRGSDVNVQVQQGFYT